MLPWQSAVRWLVREYKDMLEKWLDVPLFVGKEEHLLTAVVMKNYHRVVAIKVGRRARSREEKVAAFVSVAKFRPFCPVPA